jgi:hypothetical protein
MRTFLSVLLLLYGAVAAASADYSATVAVSDQSPAARDRGLQEALAIVLARVSGGEAPPELLDRAGSWVQQYSFEPAPAPGGLRLRAQFDARAVDQGLRERGLPVWGVYAEDLLNIGFTVSAVHTARDYTRLIGHLKSLPGIKSLSVVGVQGSEVRLQARALSYPDMQTTAGARRILQREPADFSLEPRYTLLP